MYTIISTLLSAAALAAMVASPATAHEASSKGEISRQIWVMKETQAPLRVEPSDLTDEELKTLDMATEGFTLLPEEERPDALTCSITIGQGLIYAYCHDDVDFCYAGCTAVACGAGCAPCDGNC